MIDLTPDPIAIHLGPLPVYWYGIAYAVGLAVSYVILVRQARRFGQDAEIIGNGIIVIAIAALIGGRLYHVIDQWQLYQNDLLKIILPPYAGLGVYGGLVTGILAFLVLVRYHRVNPWVWADVIAPALFAMQAIGRWGNFFNQELYGPPTTLPWGIPIDCAHRIAGGPYPCSTFPEATTFFQPLFLYESISGILGALFLIWLSRRQPYRLRAGDQALIFFIWYPIVRFLLENLRTGNWVVGGIPTAQIMSVLFALGAFLLLLYRHRRPMDDSSRGTAKDETDDWPEDADAYAAGVANGGADEDADADATGVTDAASEAAVGGEPAIGDASVLDEPPPARSSG